MPLLNFFSISHQQWNIFSINNDGWKLKDSKIILAVNYLKCYTYLGNSFSALSKTNLLLTVLQQRVQGTYTESLERGMNAKPLILDAGGKKRAFEVMDIDITNSARFGTKGLGSTTVTWIKWNADGCFSDTAVLSRQDKRMSAFSRTCWHHWYPHNRVEWGNALASQPVGTSQFVGDSSLLNTGLGTGITAKRKDFALKGLGHVH